jgi:hypothetical protein
MSNGTRSNLKYPNPLQNEERLPEQPLTKIILYYVSGEASCLSGMKFFNGENCLLSAGLCLRNPFEIQLFEGERIVGIKSRTYNPED